MIYKLHKQISMILVFCLFRMKSKSKSTYQFSDFKINLKMFSLFDKGKNDLIFFVAWVKMNFNAEFPFVTLGALYHWLCSCSWVFSFCSCQNVNNFFFDFSSCPVFFTSFENPYVLLHCNCPMSCSLRFLPTNVQYFVVFLYLISAWDFFINRRFVFTIF